MAVRNHTSNKWMVTGDGRTFQAGGLYVGDEFVNTMSTIGITIQQGASDNEAISLKSTDVDHPMTTQTETDTYGILKKYNGNDGGLQIEGFTDALVACRLYARVVTEDTTKAHESTAAVMIAGSLSTGSTVNAMSANANILLVRNYSGAKWICDSDGDTWQTGSLSLGAVTLTEADLDDLTDGGETDLHSHAGGGGFEFSSYAWAKMSETRFNFEINTYHKIPFDTALANVGDDFSTDDNWFTAPADGYYYFAAHGTFNQVDLATGHHWDIVTSNQSYDRYEDTWKWDQDGNYWPRYHSVITWMDEGDTAHVQYYQQGQVNQTDLYHGQQGTWFICANAVTV
jgi:hypothetical protein